MRPDLFHQQPRDFIGWQGIALSNHAFEAVESLTVLNNVEVLTD